MNIPTNNLVHKFEMIWFRWDWTSPRSYHKLNSAQSAGPNRPKEARNSKGRMKYHNQMWILKEIVASYSFKKISNSCVNSVSKNFCCKSMQNNSFSLKSKLLFKCSDKNRLRNLINCSILNLVEMYALAFLHTWARLFCSVGNTVLLVLHATKNQIMN